MLLIEDDQDLAELYKQGLILSGMPEGGSLLVAGSRDEALKYLRSEQVDMIIANEVLGIARGSEIIREVREGHFANVSPTTPAMMITALPEHEVEQTCRELSMDLVSKPFSLDELISFINKNLG